jgi:CheY-like chemotaxis protein
MTEAEWLACEEPQPMLEFLGCGPCYHQETFRMTQGTNGVPIEILLVEDSPDDIALTTEALRDGKVRTHLSVVEDGEEVMAFLRRQGGYAESPRPDLILLSLNLPRKNGHQVLAEIKADPDLKHIPVVMVTCSSYEKDVLQAYNCHANCYITKPVDLDQFIEMVKSIENFWLSSAVKLPGAALDTSWLTSTVTSLAQAINDDRAFDRLPILADALEDAGCTNAEMLAHCRQSAEHVGGCWVVDLLLRGRSSRP